MSQKYEHGVIEPKWQNRWAEAGLYEEGFSPEGERENFYLLMMFPEPRDDWHVGHLYAYTGVDISARYKRARGYKIFLPFGFNSFGLSTYKAAIERSVNPQKWAEDNIDSMLSRIRRLGTMIDWRSLLITHRPEYYKWSQWFFLKLLEQGLIYREFGPVDWCPSCHTTLACEQVKGEDRVCEQCETAVVKQNLNQWKIRITTYAEEFLKGLAKLVWPEHIKTVQANWIGGSRGGIIRFLVQGMEEQIEVFTTRPETAFGATFIVLAPEHPLVDEVTSAFQRDKVEEYKSQTVCQPEIRRLDADQEKTGVFTGGYAINPLTRQPIPIWVADYVLLGYGTGAIMAVPAGDQRDLDFARKYGLPVQRVVIPFHRRDEEFAEVTEVYTEPGIMINSGVITGLVTLGRYSREEWDEEHIKAYGFTLDETQPEAKEVISSMLQEQGIGEAVVNYRLQDWVVSRQYSWGAPIPLVYCQSCGTVPVPYEQLPVELPAEENSPPSSASLLALDEKFRHTICPNCEGEAERETSTLDASVDYCWHFYRSLSPHLEDAPFDPQLAAKWLPVDCAVGASEQAFTHLLYARFWTKAMRDLGLVDFSEPFSSLFDPGVILGADMQKMSWRQGNVIGADEMFEKHGADILRGYLMFIGPWEQGGPFSLSDIEGIRRFYQRIADLITETLNIEEVASQQDISEFESILHQTIERVQNAYENFRFNLVLAALMELSNTLRVARSTPLVNTTIWHEALDTFLLMLSPIAPHLTEELWQHRGNPFSIHQQPWPVFDLEKAKQKTFDLVIQLNGKVRDRVSAPVGLDEDGARKLALQSHSIQQQLNGREPRKIIYVPGRLINIVG